MASAQSSRGQAPCETNEVVARYATIQRPRERSMPLVPTPFSFSNLWPIGYLYNADTDKTRYKFFPNLKVSEYEASLTELERLGLRERANKLSRRASSNHAESSSEFWTEVIAWTYVFQQFCEDPRFRMYVAFCIYSGGSLRGPISGTCIANLSSRDKRSYDYLDDNPLSNGQTVKQRIPDASMGLRSYSDTEIYHKTTNCKRRNCRTCHEGVIHVDERLSRSKLARMQQDPDCALVVDGVWGEQHLLFPFAAYQAKKSYGQFRLAFPQVSHACATYLGMLDDLARSPDNVGKYQTADSDAYQMFAFISCGSHWEVYIAAVEYDTCSVKTIWKGNASDPGDAYELLCLVNQIYHFAINHHTPFVTSHLQRWLDRLEVLSDPLAQREEGPVGLQLAKINPGIDQYFKSFPEEDRPHLYRIPRQVRIANGAMDQYRKIREEFRQAKGWGALKADSRGSKRNKGKGVETPLDPERRPESLARVRNIAESSAVSKSRAVPKTRVRASRRPRELFRGMFSRTFERLTINNRPARDHPGDGQSNVQSTKEAPKTGQPAVETSTHRGTRLHDERDIVMIDDE